MNDADPAASVVLGTPLNVMVTPTSGAEFEEFVTVTATVYVGGGLGVRFLFRPASPETTTVSLFLGLTISSPIIIYEIYKFVNPALYDNERRLAFLFVGSFSLLFLFGVAMGYFLLVPITFRMLLGLTYMLGMNPSYEFSSFFGIVLGGTLMTGIFFTFPVFFLTLVRAGILKTSMVSGARKLIYVGIFILICIITPDPTLISDIIIFFPVVVLTEGSLLIGKYIEKKREKSKSESSNDHVTE